MPKESSPDFRARYLAARSKTNVIFECAVTDRTHFRFLRQLFVLWMIFATSMTHAATYYINESHSNASDSNPGTSADAPWKTLLKLDGYPLQPGDVVEVADGIYDLFGATGGSYEPQIDINGNGTAGNPITIRAQNRFGAVIDTHQTAGSIGARAGHAYITWDGFKLINHWKSGVKLKANSDPANVPSPVVYREVSGWNSTRRATTS